MPILQDYNHFEGYHWETGSVHNYYAYHGVKAPHTGEAYSEALLLGISGGVTMGYFTFHYKGYDPQCNILTRNTFDPLERLLLRLGVVQEVEHTSSAERAARILSDTLESGTPAIVWADQWLLPYNALPFDEGSWGMLPLVVYGYDRESDCVLVADRANVPLRLSTGDLAAARGRVKKEKHRLLTLDTPDPRKVPSAVRLGIWDCIRLYTEKPPRGSCNNFGFAAYRYWARMLTESRQRSSWEKLFPAGVPMYAGLCSAFHLTYIAGKGLDGDAERGQYAAFLEEAALILGRSSLADAAARFRDSAAAWKRLQDVLLPSAIAPFRESREQMWRRHELFLSRGGEVLEEVRQIDSRLATLRDRMAKDFPLDNGGVAALREGIAEQLLAIHAAEQEAVEALRDAVA